MRSLSIRTLLAIFAISIVGPTLLLAGALAWRFVEQEREGAEDELRQLARNVLVAVDRDIVGIESSLQALSTSLSLKRGDYAAFHRQASQAKAFNGTNVVVRDLTGQQVVNTRLPYGSPLPQADRTSDERTAALRAPYVSDLFRGAVAAEPLFIVNAPIFGADDSEIIGFMNMSLSPDRIRDVIRQTNVPEGWSVGVLDRQGVIVGRFPEHEAFVGRQASEHFRDNTPGPAGMYLGVNLKNVSVVTAYARSPRFGWIVTASAPKALLDAPLRRTLYAIGGMAAVLLALSALMALWFGRRISGPMRALAARAAALGRGEPVPAAPLGLREVDLVGRDLAGASESLAQERRSLETLNAVGRDLAAELDRNRLVQRVIDAATSLTGAAYGAFFERVPATKGAQPTPESWRLFALSGAPLEAFTRFGLPRATAVFAPTFAGEGLVRSDDILADPRYGSHGGMPSGHLPVRSYLATPVRSRSGEMLGALLFGHPEPARFGLREEHIAEGIAGQAAIALDNAALFNSAQTEILQRRMAEREERRLNEVLAERAGELKESNEELQRYAYIVSHDLRAPLVNVMGFTNELRSLKPDLLAAGSRPEGDPQRQRAEQDFDESIAFIDVAVAKMEALIAAILKLSREGRRTFRPEPIAMAAAVRDLADSLRHQIDAAGAEVVVAPDLPDIVADRLAIEQIFGNLLDNAVKYLAPDRRGRIEVEGETMPGGRLRYRVRDNGRGIAPADHARVFELFRRAGRQDRPGEGIGLAHVKALVRALGGRIEVGSTLGEGSVFTITLPQSSAEAADGPTPRAAAE